MSFAIAGVAAFQILTSFQQAEMIRENAELTKRANLLNAEYAEIDAYNAEIEGYSASAKYEGQADKQISTQRVATAASDVDVTFGTAAEVIQESKLNKILNSMDIRNQYHMKALGYKNQASGYRMAGNQVVAQGALNASATQNAGLINAAATGISGYNYKG